MKILKRLFNVAMTLGMLALSTGVLAADQNTENAHKNTDDSTIVIGIDKFEPYSYQDINGNFVGIDVDLANLAFERLGYKTRFQIIPWSEKDKLLDQGKIDCIWSCYSMSGREQKYQWAGPYMYSRQTVAVRIKSDIQTLADLKNRIIGVQTTTKAENVFLRISESKLTQVRWLYSFSSVEDLFASLRKGYVDAIAGHEALITKFVNSNPEIYRMLNESPYISQIGVAFKKDSHQELAQKLTETIKDMKEDGVIAQIAQKYGLNAEKTVW